MFCLPCLSCASQGACHGFACSSCLRFGRCAGTQPGCDWSPFRSLLRLPEACLASGSISSAWAALLVCCWHCPLTCQPRRTPGVHGAEAGEGADPAPGLSAGAPRRSPESRRKCGDVVVWVLTPMGSTQDGPITSQMRPGSPLRQHTLLTPAPAEWRWTARRATSQGRLSSLRVTRSVVWG